MDHIDQLCLDFRIASLMQEKLRQVRLFVS